MAIDEKAKSPSEDLIFQRLCRLRLVPWGRGEQTSNERRRPAVRDLTREDAVFYEENELQDAALSAGSHLIALLAALLLCIRTRVLWLSCDRAATEAIPGRQDVLL